MQEEPKNKTDETVVQEDVQPEEVKTVPVVEEPTIKTDPETGEVILPQDEFEKLNKKAKDFDGMIEKQRLQKLSAKENKPEAEIDNSDVISEAARIAEETTKRILSESNVATYNENLGKAYQLFISENKWADGDEIFKGIQDKFDSTGVITVEQIKNRLEEAAQKAFPDKYKKAMEDKVRAKVMAESSDIEAGGGGSAATIPKVNTTKVNYQPTDEDKRVALKYFGGDMQRYLKATKKI